MSDHETGTPQPGTSSLFQPARRLTHRLEEGLANRAADLMAGAMKLGGKRAYRYLLRALKERQPAAVDADIRLVAPNYVDPDPVQRPLVERIFAAYSQAKRDEASCDPLFLPYGGWKNVVDTAFSSLIEGWKNSDMEGVHFFLANFGAWREPTGITESHKLQSINKSKQRKRHFEQRVMAELVSWWQLFESQGRDLSTLSLPRVGNQCGALVDGHFLSTDSVASDVDSRLLTGLIDCQRPVLAELGGGFGRLLYFVSRQISDFTYVGLDLPECLCCASYYLMQVFPEKRFLLYGEGPLTGQTVQQYDVILLPSFQIRDMTDCSVDLFLNENSLGLMTPRACGMFVQEICRTSRSFWHRNHEVRRNRFVDGTTSLVNREYPIPYDRFSQVVRYADIRRFIGPEGWTLENDMFWYYYRRRS